MPSPQFGEWLPPHHEEHAAASAQWSVDKDRKRILDFLAVGVEESGTTVTEAKETVRERFLRLADDWSREIGNSSSLTTVTRNKKYQEIIDLGWDVLPYMLVDLQTKHRFWFPALYEITQVRPFDERDAGNSKRMIQAWVQWGKRKKLI
jgi:hypothetical protein